MTETAKTVGAEVRARLPAPERQLRLLASACCRRAWRLLVSERSRRAVMLAERHADGLVDFGRLQDAHIQAKRVIDRAPGPAQQAAAALAAFAADPRLARRHQAEMMVAWLDLLGNYYLGPEPLEGAFRALFDDVFGPARLREPSRSWRTPVVLDIALRVRQERDALAMFVLGDALEEAGCDDEGLLEHCRSGGPHVRGCWAVDLLLADCR
jgi:hypothetical protein